MRSEDDRTARIAALARSVLPGRRRGGCCIVATILDKLGHDRLTVSDRGLRHGLFLDRFDG